MSAGDNAAGADAGSTSDPASSSPSDATTSSASDRSVSSSSGANATAPPDPTAGAGPGSATGTSTGPNTISASDSAETQQDSTADSGSDSAFTTAPDTVGTISADAIPTDATAGADAVGATDEGNSATVADAAGNPGDDLDPAPQSVGGSSASVAPVRPYSVGSWLPLVTALAGDIPVAFVQAWNAKESGGNPCAIGHPGAQGPDGNPLEMGLGQLYNPDNFQALGIDAGSWRAYCDGGGSTVTRDLTLDECTSQVNGMIGLIKRCRTAARKYNPGWSEISADFWSLVKLQHALPGLLHGVPAVTAKLGRAPNSWAEFRATVVTVTLDAKTMQYSDNFAKELDNAEATGAAVQ